MIKAFCFKILHLSDFSSSILGFRVFQTFAICSSDLNWVVLATNEVSENSWSQNKCTCSSFCMRKAAPVAAEKYLPPDHGLVGRKVLFGFFWLSGSADERLAGGSGTFAHLLEMGMVLSRYHEPNASLTSL